MLSLVQDDTSLPIFILRIISPSIVFLIALSILPSKPSPLSQSDITPVVVATRVPRRAFILTALSLIALTYFLDGLSFVVDAVIRKSWPHFTGIDVSALVGLIGFAGVAIIGAWKDIYGANVWFMARLKLAILVSLGLDTALVILLGLAIKWDSIKIPELPRSMLLRDLIHFALPALRLLLLFPLLVALLYPRRLYVAVDVHEEVAPTASSFLLQAGQENHGTGLAPPESSKYGTFRDPRTDLQRSATTTRPTTPSTHNAPEQKEIKAPNIDVSWSDTWKRLKRLTPYLWPKKSRALQLLATLCMLILILGRVVNVAVPLVLGQLIRVLDGTAHGSPWPWVFAYVGLRYLQGSGGLSAIRDCLWAPVMQYSDREMSQLSFDHLLNLSFSWHTHRKTGEVLRVLDRGAAINRTFELILFNIVPTFVDIAAVLVAFSIIFEWTLSLVIFVVMFAYVTVSVLLTRWRNRLRRQMVERDVITRGIHTDCLLNYETVKYFNGEEYEGNRYRNAIRDYQSLEFKVITSLNLLNLVQNFIITLGLLVGSLIVASRVTQGLSDAGHFVAFLTFLAQLYTPLNQLGSIYRSINTALIDTEKLLQLLNEPTEINDKPDAPDLLTEDGEIEFDNVNFSYDGRATALNGVSFKVPKGSSVALVGESGAGKSTILRLLYRFYDLREGQGRILIDGQDIREVTQKSLRQAIGVVPQDSVLFNASITYNIGYGKFGASMQEIEAAARSAQMHDRILSFPEGYETKVGERGIRLSGGEKQRVAIARTLLKNPPILLLDEATSALDTSTEKDIHKALQNLVQGRSSLSIAHRLSTIASADLILVLKDGQIVEQGTHKELLARDGIFASMWADQVSSADEAAAIVGEDSPKKEAEGYRLDGEQDQTDSGPSTQKATDTQDQAELMEVPSSKNVEAIDGAESTGPVQFPTSSHDTEVTEPVHFPTSTLVAEPDESPMSNEPITTHPASRTASPAPTPAITFDANLSSPPRTGTPDPDSEPKKKRMSSQNFQRLARRISITAKRQSSSLIPSFKKDSSPRVSVDDSRPEGSDSPAGSIRLDDKSKSKKKDKKERKSTS